MDWTTRFQPEMTRRFGVEEMIHTVCFEPDGWPGKGPCIGLGIPECELQYCVIGADGEPAAFVNRPQRNQKLKYWLRFVCEMATKERSFVMFSCDTVEQAERVARLAAKRLPRHQRVALERMYDAQSRARGNLS